MAKVRLNEALRFNPNGYGRETWDFPRGECDVPEVVAKLIAENPFLGELVEEGSNGLDALNKRELVDHSRAIGLTLPISITRAILIAAIQAKELADLDADQARDQANEEGTGDDEAEDEAEDADDNVSDTEASDEGAGEAEDDDKADDTEGATQ